MSDNSFYGPLDDPAGNAGYDEHPPRMGFFTDTSVCIGCKACEVACKEWNLVPDDGFDLLGMSFVFIDVDRTADGEQVQSWIKIPEPRLNLRGLGQRGEYGMFFERLGLPLCVAIAAEAFDQVRPVVAASGRVEIEPPCGRLRGGPKHGQAGRIGTAVAHAVEHRQQQFAERRRSGVML